MSNHQSAANTPSMETPAPPRSTPSRRPIVIALAVGIALSLAALLLQAHAGAYQSEFGAHADEPAHVVTGMMVRDYLAGGMLEGTSPMKFARDYYERYPKVALGHYPPAFYVIEGIWLIPSRSPAATLVLMAVMAATAAFLTWRAALHHDLPHSLAWIPAALFITHPLVRIYTAIVMSDLLLVIFCLLATGAWRRFLGSSSTRDALTFGLWAAAAILTKGSGLFLALLPPLSIALSGKWQLLKSRSLWLAPIPVIVLAMPWMVATRHITAEGMSHVPLPEYIAGAIPFFARNLIGEFGWIACLLTLAACASAAILALRGRPVDDSTACHVAIIVGLLVFYIAIPSGLDARYFLPLVPSLFLLVTDAARRLADLIAGRLSPASPPPQRTTIATAGTCLLAAAIWLESTRPVSKSFGGYAEVIEAIAAEPSDLAGGEQIDILVASAPHGEGSAITAAVFSPDAPIRIHRSTKALIDTDWLGREPRPVAPAGEELWRHVRELGIEWILLEEIDGQPQVELLEQSLPSGLESSSHTIRLKNGVTHQLRRIRVPG